MNQRVPDQYIKIPHTVRLLYRYAAGPYMARFCKELRENKRLVANRCPRCRRILFPPRISCPDCMVRAADEWVEVGPGGTLLFFAEVGRPGIDTRTGEVQELPASYACLIQPDGVLIGQGCFSHWLKVENPEKLREGMRVEPVFKEERRLGTLEDILYYVPVEE